MWFADDMIITARSRAQAELILELLGQFLVARGLKLNWSKTCISKVSLGFEFLSRWYRREDSVLVTRPSNQTVKRFESSLESFILGHKGSQQTLIERLNRKLNSQGSYHRATNTYDAFRRISSSVQTFLIKEMRQLHPKRKWKTVQDMYWYEQDGRHILTLRYNKTVRVARLAKLEITEHKPIRLSFRPYLSQGYYTWLRRRRDDQKVSGAKRRRIWRRQAGCCHYYGRPMLLNQKIQLVELVLGRGRTVSSLTYIHRSCTCDAVIKSKEGGATGLDVFALLDGVTEPVRGLEDPYWAPQELFRLRRQPSVTLTLGEIETIIDFELGWKTRYFQAFWFDETSAYVGGQWEEEFPFHAMEPSQQATEYIISDAWRNQGCRIQRLDLPRRKMVLHQEVHGTAGLTIPPALLRGRIPENVAYEATTFFAYLIKKYSL